MPMLKFEEALSLCDRVIEPMVASGRLVAAGQGTLGEAEVERLSSEAVATFNDIVENLSAEEMSSMFQAMLMERASAAVKRSFIKSMVIGAMMDGTAEIHEVDLGDLT